MEMLGRRLCVGLGTVVLATACLGFASTGSHKSSERGKDVTFRDTMKFKSGDTLPAGTYRMEVAEGTTTPDVKFYQNGQVMATEKAQVVTRQSKNKNTEVDVTKEGDAQLVTSIKPEGWKESLKFGSSSQ